MITLRKSMCLVLSLFINPMFAGKMGAVDENFDFGGLYVGLQMGALTVFTDYSETKIQTGSSTTTSNSSESISNTAILFSGDIGYGAMLHNFYIGGKGSMSYGPLYTKSVDSTTLLHGITRGTGRLVDVLDNMIAKYERSLQPIYNLDAVLGYEIIPHVLPYIEGGISFANMTLTHTENTSYSPLDNANGAPILDKQNITLNHYRTGYNLGAGINYQPYRHWILTTEVIYTNLGSNSHVIQRQIERTAVTTTATEKNQSVGFLAGITYLF